MWYNESVFYQIYPLGFCGAPNENDGIVNNRIRKISDWIPHMKKLGINALYLGPVFSSDSHGYDTRDYKTIDPRLGSNSDFKSVCESLHGSGIKIVLDGVFNHVGRGFWAFQDVLEKKQSSEYKEWFHLDFGRRSACDDEFWYEGWEGHYNLVKLNLHNPQVVKYICESIELWIREWDIDGLRLDVAYLLDESFLRQLRSFCKAQKADFFLLGEMIHGDYNRITNSEMLDSSTNYECFKGLYSSFNDRNMFEIAYSLNRQFGQESHALYRDLPLLCFLDNHDVSRIASVLKETENLKAIYGLLFGMPGIPCIYYGSEWGAEGKKEPGSDSSLRPCFSTPIETPLTQWISTLSKLRASNPALSYGSYKQLYLTNLQLVFLREHQENKIVIAINIDSNQHTASLPLSGELFGLTSDKNSNAQNIILQPHSAKFYILK